MKRAPEEGSRWRFGRHGATYEVVEGESRNADYVMAKIVSRTTDQPIGGTVELAIGSLGSTYKRVKKKGSR